MSVKGKQIDLWYFGKSHKHGGNVQALSRPDGFPLWVADGEAGAHDLTAAREHVLGALCWAASRLDLPTLADSGYGKHSAVGVVAGHEHGGMTDRVCWSAVG